MATILLISITKIKVTGHLLKTQNFTEQKIFVFLEGYKTISRENNYVLWFLRNDVSFRYFY